MTWSKPISWYSDRRSATSSWLPTSAVPAPPRTRPKPAHRFGATTSFVAVAAVQGGHAGLADRRRSDRRPPLGPRPITSGGIASSRRSASVHAAAAVSRVIVCRRMPKRTSRPWASARARRVSSSVRRGVGRFTPHEPDVGVAGGDALAGVGGAAEEDRRPGIRCVGDEGLLDLVVLAREVEGLAAHRAAQHGEELVAAVVAAVVVEVVAEAALLDGAAAGHDVEQQPPAAEPLEGRSLLGGERRRDQPRPERDEEPQPLGGADERRGASARRPRRTCRSG